jgi:predicted PurR-regulated permease PerM
VVAFFERTGHKRVPRVAILVVVYVGVLALIVGAVISVGSRIAEQAASASR